MTDSLSLLQDRAKAASRSRTGLWLFLLLLAVYLLTAKGFSDLIDAEATYLITENLVEEGRVDVPASGALTPEVHAAGHSFEGPDGHLYSQYWLGYPIFQVPWYVLGKGAGYVAAALSPKLTVLSFLFPRVAINLALGLVTALQAVVLCALVMLLYGDLRTAVLTALLFGLATVAWPYSKIGFYEPFLGLCLLVTMYCLAVYAYRRPHWGWLMGAGFAWGWAVATKPTVALTLPALVVYVAYLRLRPRPAQVGFKAPLLREVGLVLLGCVPWILVCLWYNWVRSGSPLSLGYASWNWEMSLAPEQFWRFLAAYMIGPARGFFSFCPVALLAIIGWRAAYRRIPGEALAVLLMFLAYWLFHAARAAPDSWAWGPRYLVPLVGPVMLLAPWGIERLRSSSAGHKVLLTLIALGVSVQLLSIVVPYGIWLHKVCDQTASSRAVVFSLRYWPLKGQVNTLLGVETSPLSLSSSGLQAGSVAEEFKWHLRHSLDFWWFYAWRLGAPWPLILLPLLILVGLVVFSAQALTRRLRPWPT